MRKTLPQIKSELLKEIEDYLEGKGVKGEDLKQRIKELKEKCPPDLRYNLLVLKDYYGEKKDPIQYDKEGVAIPAIIDKLIKTKDKQGEKEMGDRVELQKKIDALKKLNKAQLANIAKEGRYMGVKFLSLEITPSTDAKDSVKMIAYKIQDAMGLGSDKSKENQQTASKAPATKETIPTKAASAAKKPAPATKVTSGRVDMTPVLKLKEQLKAEKEKSKIIIVDLKAKGKTDIEVLKGKHKDALLQAAEKLTAEKDKGKAALEKAKERSGADLMKIAIKLSTKLSLSLENERRLAGENKRLLALIKEDNKKMSLDLRKEEKLKTDLAKGIKFLEKLI